MSIVVLLKKNMKKITPVEQWRKQERKKARQQEQAAKYKPPPLIKTSRQIIIGFDADVDKCGVTAYDAELKKVIRFDDRPIYECNTWLDNLIQEQGKERLFARVEIADKSTVWGRVEDYFFEILLSKPPAYFQMPKNPKSYIRRMTRTQKGALARHIKQESTKAFGIISSSYRSAGLASVFIKLLEKRNIPYQLVNSSDRLNIENWQNGTYKDFDAKRLLMKLRMKGSFTYPTKLNAEQVKTIFRLPKGGNQEKRDALCLAMPELIWGIK